ncbi:MAG: TolC family protein [Candidatus Rifleibacteriota bacterium]
MKNSVFIKSLLMVLTLFFMGSNLLWGAQFKVAVVFDGPSEKNSNLVDKISDELSKLVTGYDRIVFPKNYHLSGDWNKTKIELQLNKALASKEIDAVISLGPVSSHLLCQKNFIRKPAFAAQVLNADIQKIRAPEKLPENLNYINYDIDVAQHLQKLQEIQKFSRLAVITGSYFKQGIPELKSFLTDWAKDHQLKIEYISTDNLLNYGASQLRNIDSAYILPVPQLNKAAFKQIVSHLIDKKIPSMNMFGQDKVKQGIVVSLAENINSDKLARRLALNLQRLTFEEIPADFSTAFSHDSRLHINMETARKIKVYPTWEQMIEAVLINAEPEDVQRELTLTQVIETAVVRNLQLAAKKQELEADGHGIDRASSRLRPQLNLFGRENVIDSDRAETIMTPSKYTTQIGADLKQVIYSEQAQANVDIKKYMLAAKEEEERALILDIMKDAALAYLNVLKARTMQTIQRDNLEVTRKNLELAKFREQVGTSGPAEIYRWEIQMASSRQAVIDASVMRKKAELAMNQLLNTSQEEEFTTADCDIFAKIFLIDQKGIAPYIDNQYGFKVFRDFLVKDSFAFSPEIRKLKQTINAQQRARRSAKRRYTNPTVALQGNFTRNLKKAGIGEPKPPLSGPFSNVFSYPDDNDWFVGVNVSIPLHEGGDRRAAIKQTDAVIGQLENNLDFLMQRLELNTRVTLEDARSSFSSIGLSNSRAEYASKALDLVQSAYQRGAVNILDLIDAQNASLVAKEASANAMYNFFGDFVKVCRAVGNFDFILNQQSHDVWKEKLKNYYRINAVNAVIDRKPAAQKPEIGKYETERTLYEEK